MQQESFHLKIKYIHNVCIIYIYNVLNKKVADKSSMPIFFSKFKEGKWDKKERRGRGECGEKR